MRRSARRGLTLLEVTVALAVLAIGVLSLERLLARSVATIADDAALTRTMLAARRLVAAAALAPPEPGIAEGEVDGLRYRSEVRPTPHRALREVRVRVAADGDRAAAELVEVVRVPAE